MSIRYSDDFKKEVVKAYMAGDKSTVQIAADYNIAKTTPESNEAREIRRLNQLLNEKDKEIDFLKKAAAFFAKEIDQWYIDLSTIIKIYLV